jgi:Glycosyltransferase sugar-binding region containing DXD motif
MKPRSLQQKDGCRIRPLRVITLVIVALTCIQLWFLSNMSMPPMSPLITNVETNDEKEPINGATVIPAIPENDTPMNKKKTRRADDALHAIPRNLIFTHYKNLLGQYNQRQRNNHNSLVEMDDEEIALAENVQHSIQVHNNASSSFTSVLFWTDHECIESLGRVYPSLVPFFQNETEGMYKADICRGAALYEHGGFYLDVDVGVRHSLWQDLRTSTEFVTARVHRQSNYPGHFFQAILGAKAKSPVLFRYLRLFEKHYTGLERVKKGPLGVILLKRAWEYVSQSDSSLQSKTELYQEILYNPRLFPDLHPAPTWGTRRACHFVVVATVNREENVEMIVPSNQDGKPMKLQVPALSRIPGSRMCPDEVDGKKQITKWWTRD